MQSEILSSIQAFPKFVLEGYAIYAKEGNKELSIPEKYLPYIEGSINCKGPYVGFDFIGVKPDAPEWAKDEYEQWQSRQKRASKELLAL